MDGGSEERSAELCDVCGAVIEDDSQLYSLVPDSSFIHRTDPDADGQRLVVACGEEHLAQLQREYEARPFVDEELWAGKVGRAVRAAYPAGLQPDDLAAATGLRVEQVDRAVAWHNARARRTGW